MTTPCARGAREARAHTCSSKLGHVFKRFRNVLLGGSSLARGQKDPYTWGFNTRSWFWAAAFHVDTWSLGGDAFEEPGGTEGVGAWEAALRESMLINLMNHRKLLRLMS